MAEGFLNHLGTDEFQAYSAGVNPGRVHPLSIKVMQEKGIDISMQVSKSLKQFIKQDFDYVVTVCDNARQSCPVFAGKYEKIHWNLDDPAKMSGSEEDKLKVFRQVRDIIETNIELFLKDSRNK